MTMVSRLPRQIAGLDAAYDKSPERIQKIVDNGPEANVISQMAILGMLM